MLKRYYHRENQTDSASRDNKSQQVNGVEDDDERHICQAAAVACVIEKDDVDEELTVLRTTAELELLT